MHAARISLGRMFQAESTNFFLLLGLTLFMVAFGLLMVLSASYVDAHAAGSNFFAKFLSQAGYALVGVPLMFVLSRLPIRFWQRWAWPLLILGWMLQALVVFTPLGVEINNNRNWLDIGPVVFQPSEAIKLALVVWLAMFLQRKEDRIQSFRYTVIPVLLVCGISLGLVMAGGDLGTVMIMGALVFGALFFAGVRLRHLLGTGIVAIGLVLMFAFSSSNRLDRILAFLHPAADSADGTHYQVQQGMWGMANGGILGVGLGNSQAKWNWLPASSTDFIFAITAEELGLIGAVLVLCLFVGLALVFVSILRSSETTFSRVATGAVMAWLIVQAIVNIAVVLGLFPVLGVPLPLISSGGTALISTLVGIGIVLSFARTEGTRRGGVRRS